LVASESPSSLHPTHANTMKNNAKRRTLSFFMGQLLLQQRIAIPIMTTSVVDSMKDRCL
jgi:hypothetical protein